MYKVKVYSDREIMMTDELTEIVEEAEQELEDKYGHKLVYYNVYHPHQGFTLFEGGEIMNRALYLFSDIYDVSYDYRNLVLTTFNEALSDYPEMVGELKQLRKDINEISNRYLNKNFKDSLFGELIDISNDIARYGFSDVDEVVDALDKYFSYKMIEQKTKEDYTGQYQDDLTVTIIGTEEIVEYIYEDINKLLNIEVTAFVNSVKKDGVEQDIPDGIYYEINATQNYDSNLEMVVACLEEYFPDMDVYNTELEIW